MIGAAQHGLWIWLHSGGVDGLLDAARLAARTLAPAATLGFEQLAFPSRTQRSVGNRHHFGGSKRPNNPGPGDVYDELGPIELPDP
jgi:hypothetical protein